MESVSELKKKLKEMREGVIAGGGAGVEEMKREIAYHEAARKSAESMAKRGAALAKAREAKKAKAVAEKPKKAVEVAEKPRKVVEKPVEKPKKVKVAPEPEVMLTKNIRVKKVKVEDDE